MNLHEEIGRERSKAQSGKIADWIGADESRFAQLMGVFQEKDIPLAVRAAWIVNLIAETHPKLLLPHLDALVARMEEVGIPSPVKRHVMNSLQYVDIPESLHGRVMNAGFSFLEDPEEPIAVRAFSMTVLADLARIYPDIKGELRLIIEDILVQGASAGIRSRAQKVLKSIGND